MTMNLIQHIELGSAQANITFSSIPSAFTDLLVVCSLRSDRPSALSDDLQLSINSQGNGTNITIRSFFGDGSQVGNTTNAVVAGGVIPAASVTSSTFSNTQIYFPNYSGSANKSFSTEATAENNGLDAYRWLVSGLWSQTSPITSITLDPNTGNLVAGSSATLYGITKGSDGITTVS